MLEDDGGDVSPQRRTGLATWRLGPGYVNDIAARIDLGWVRCVDKQKEQKREMRVEKCGVKRDGKLGRGRRTQIQAHCGEDAASHRRTGVERVEQAASNF